MRKREFEWRKEAIEATGHHLVTYSPGGGARRYRIVAGEPDYFAGRELFTATGWREAKTMIDAFLTGWRVRDCGNRGELR